MTSRALLIGAQTYGLTGVHRDVHLMRTVLREHGFTDVRTRTEDQADYAGIKEGLDLLDAATQQDDPVVVYYSGHGALLGRLQYLVPVDMESSTPTDFRGLLAEELTAAVRRLALKTTNITVILDCCHSAGTVREGAQTPARRTLKSVGLPRVAHDAALVRASGLTVPGDPLVPGVVRLVACQQHDFAYEAELRPGSGRQGVFTAALADLLAQRHSARVPWSVLMSRIRDRIAQQQIRQWPDAGGPWGRLPFTTEEPAEPERLPLTRRDGRFLVPGGAVFGLGECDTVSMVLPGGDPGETTEAEPGPLAAEIRVPATVYGLSAGDALLSPRPEEATCDRTDVDRPPVTAGELRTALLPPGSYALPVRVHDRRRVAVDAEGPFADALREGIARCPRLTCTEEEREVFATVRVRDGRYEVRNPEGRPWRAPSPVNPADPSPTITLLEELARGDRVRQLRTPEGSALLHSVPEILVEREHATGDGARRPLAPEGEFLYDGDRYWVTVTNTSDAPLHFWVVGVGLSGRTALITNDQPSGYRLEPRDAEHGSSRTTPGVKVYWPSDVPEQGPCRETIHVLVGDRQMDLGGLASRTDFERSVRAGDSALEALLTEVWDGVRDQQPVAGDEFHYRVRTVHAQAVPPSSARGRSTTQGRKGGW